MNFTKLLVISSWIYILIYILFGLPMDHWYLRAIRGVCSIVCSFSLLFFIFHLIERWKARTT